MNGRDLVSRFYDMDRAYHFRGTEKTIYLTHLIIIT